MQDNEKALLCGTSLHFHKWLLNGQREIPGRIPPQHQHCTGLSRMSPQAYPPDSIPRCSHTRTENLGLWAMMNTSRDLLHLPHTSTRRVRRGGPSDLVPFGGAARTYKISGPVHQPSGARASKVIMSPRRSFSTARSWHARAGDTPDSSHVNIKEYPRLPVSIVPNTSLMPDSGNILQHALPSFHTACTPPYLHTACRSHPFTPNALPIPSQRMPCQLEKMMQK